MAKLESLESSFKTSFPYPSLSAASADFGASATAASNEKVSSCVSLALDALSSISQDAQTLENFLYLHIPQMEDGNNFGVSIQLAALKQLSELQDGVTKHMDALAGYANARADLQDKLTPTVSKSISKSTSTKDGKTEESITETSDEKTNESLGGAIQAGRLAAIVACDTLYYSKAQRALQTVLTLYIASLDFVNKNMAKIEKPKNEGGHSGFSSMY